jgi:hypothetical protein
MTRAGGTVPSRGIQVSRNSTCGPSQLCFASTQPPSPGLSRFGVWQAEFEGAGRAVEAPRALPLGRERHGPEVTAEKLPAALWLTFHGAQEVLEVALDHARGGQDPSVGLPRGRHTAMTARPAQRRHGGRFSLPAAVAARVRDVRLAMGSTQDEMARAAGLSSRRVTRCQGTTGRCFVGHMWAFIGAGTRGSGAGSGRSSGGVWSSMRAPDPRSEASVSGGFSCRSDRLPLREALSEELEVPIRRLLELRPFRMVGQVHEGVGLSSYRVSALGGGGDAFAGRAFRAVFARGPRARPHHRRGARP